jgi:hypothetical protein
MLGRRLVSLSTVVLCSVCVCVLRASRYFTTEDKRGVFVKKSMICKALSLHARLPAGLERELQKQVHVCDGRGHHKRWAVGVGVDATRESVV